MTKERLVEILDYNKDTGDFLWKDRPNRPRNTVVGGIAGYINNNGYVVIKADGINYTASHLAFLHENGRLPYDQIDHINHMRDDNRIDNLREVDNNENRKNMSKFKNNTSGVTGVNWSKNAKRWHATISVDTKRIHLGYFSEFSEAVNARKNAEVLYGFHENHGQGAPQ